MGAVKRRGVWIGVAVVLVAIAALGWWGYSQAKQFESLARAGRSDAAAALKSLEAEQSPVALASFEKAGAEFAQARAPLGPGWLRGVPWLGRQLDAAEDLATIGVEGSRAGAAASRLLVESNSVSGEERLGKLLEVARPHLDEALVALVAVRDGAAELNPDGLVGPLAEAVSAAKEQLQSMELVLSRSEALLELERYMFSRQHRFVVLAQNSAQLRPTGGFIGTFGLVELGPDGFDLTDFADVYTLPPSRVKVPAPDGWVMTTQWLRFRTANWWLDFPTSAKTLVSLWEGTKSQPEIDGVIAIDLPTIRDLLKVFGPIRVPESDVALTAKNVVEQLSYTVEIENSGKTVDKRKDAVISLAKAVMERLTHLKQDEFSPVLSSLATSANEKHVQLYLTDADAQADIVASGWSGALAPPEGTTDLLAVSNAVIARPAKGNLGVDKSLAYAVELQPDGSATTTLELGYRKDSSNPLGMHQDAFPNQVRVNRGTATTLTGGKQVSQIEDATGLPTFSNVFELPLGQSKTVRMTTRVPTALQSGAATAVPGAPAASAPASGEVWHYRLLLAKQADLVNTDAEITVKAPEGFRIADATAWFRVDGKAVGAKVVDGTATVTTPLRQDLLVDVLLVRS